MDERLKEAFHKIYEAEAKAALRFKIFAKKAEQEGLPQIAQLFRVIGFSEEVHGERAHGERGAEDAASEDRPRTPELSQTAVVADAS